MQFVVPDGYHGVFSVTLDTTRGAVVPVTNGQYIVTIPASGKMSVSSFDFVMGKHVVAARYVSGESLPPSHDPMALALRLVTVTPDMKTAVYLIGTQKEAEDALKKY